MSVTPAPRGRGRVSERNTSLIFTKIEIKEKCLKRICKRASRANVFTLAEKREMECFEEKSKSKSSFIRRGKQSNEYFYWPCFFSDFKKRITCETKK